MACRLLLAFMNTPTPVVGDWTISDGDRREMESYQTPHVRQRANSDWNMNYKFARKLEVADDQF